jgi:hypothetical protein
MALLFYFLWSVELERVKGIEPSYSAWKAAALPLSYTRDFGGLLAASPRNAKPIGRFAGVS